MNISDKRVKLLFAAFAATLLIAFLPLNASAQANVASVSEASTTVSNLYKYLYHVNVTQYPWAGFEIQNTNFNPAGEAPSTNHILWIAKSKPYEGLRAPTCVINGVVIVSVDTGHSIYDNSPGIYAFDQNTGDIIWTYPGLTATLVIDDTHLLCGRTMINPATGEYLYDVPGRSISIYVPELKMGFGSGPSPGLGGATMMAQDYSDPEHVKSVWTSEPEEIIAFYAYDNGKIFYGGRNMYSVICADARTGNVLWKSNCPDFIVGALVGNGKLYAIGWTGGAVFDQDTGQLLWRVPNHGREISRECALAYDMFYAVESDSYFYALDANDGGMIWKYDTVRDAPFPAGPAAESLSWMGYTSGMIAGDGKIYCKTLGHTAYGRLIDPGWVSEDGNQWNPHPYEVLAQPGTGELSCLDAYTGALIWKCGVEEVGPPGLGMGTSSGGVIADGRAYFTQEPYSGHVGVGTTRPYSEITDPKYFINYEWFPPSVWCFGKGPTQFKDLAISQSEVKYGENVTVTGKLVDLSPAIDKINSLSTYSRPVGSPATKVPVVLSFISSNGTAVPFATVNTDNDGMFSATWYPWETGSLQIVVESAGSGDYEAPDTAYTAVTVTPVVPNLVPLLEGALAIAVIMAIVLPVIVYIRKPKQ